MNSNNRICFLVDATNIHGLRWIQPVIDLGYEVFVLSYVSGGKSQSFESTAGFIDLNSIFHLRRVRSFVWGAWIYRYLRILQPAIFHVHQMPAGGLITRIAQFHPTIVTAWGSDLLVTPWRSKFWHRVTRSTLKHVDYLTVPSQIMYDAALKLEYPEENLLLIPWGLETNVFKPVPDDRMETRSRLKVPSNSQLLLSPRAIAAQYNHDIVLEALKMLVGEFPELHLVMIRYNVDRDYETKISNMIRQFDLQSKVTLIPAQYSKNEMAKIYRAADVVVSIPSSEGYGFTAYEALACGRPTIITDLPVFEGELVDNMDVLKVPVQDIELLHASIQRLLLDKNLKKQLVTNGLWKTKSRHSDNRIEQVIQLYNLATNDKYT